MDALQSAANALDQARIAIRHVDLEEAERWLVVHDDAVRRAVAEGRVVVSEMAFLAAEQQALLKDLIDARSGVEAQLRDVGRSAGAARAYRNAGA